MLSLSIMGYWTFCLRMSHSFGKHYCYQTLSHVSSLQSHQSFPHLSFHFWNILTCIPIYLLHYLILIAPFLIQILLISLLDWSTLAQEKALLLWILTSHLVCVLALSRVWRPMCSGWILPRSYPPGLICWWKVATMLLNSSKRSPQVLPGSFFFYSFLHLLFKNSRY